MMSKIAQKPILFLFLLIFFLSGCSYFGIPLDNLPWVSDDPIYFKDSFEVQSGGWTTFDDGMGIAGYDQGRFRLKASIENYQFWSVPGLNFKDTMVVVRATKIDGPDNNLFGLICRYQNEANYYAFVIGSDGYYGIFKVIDGQQTLIDKKHMDFSNRINLGNAENQIQAVCKEDQLILLVNGEQLLFVTDDALIQGDVGLIVGNFSSPGTDILFDNFIVAKP